MGGSFSASPEFGVGILLHLGTAIFLGFLSAFLSLYMLFAKDETDQFSVIFGSSVVGLIFGFFLGIYLLGSISSSLDYLNSFVKGNPYITPFDYMKVYLFLLLIVLIITVPPVIFIRRLLLSRPYKKAEKRLAIIASASVLLIIFAWVVYIAWCKVTGYNGGL